MKRAILLSGGLDSASLCYWLRPEIAVTLDYGQVPAEAEERAASALCQTLQIEHVCVKCDCSAVGSGHLAAATSLPMAPAPEWWPFRNQLLITLAAAVVLRHGCSRIMVGAVKEDESHADGRQEFFNAIDRLLSIQEGSVRVDAPALLLTSSQLVRKSGIPLELLAWSHSCHRSNHACGSCRGCLKHKNVMYELGQVPY